jgi:hypothetical protein
LLKITLKYLIVFFFLTILFTACTEESFDCPECDEPHQSFYVNIVDTLARPVSSLIITVKDACGNVLFVPQSPIAAAIGQYTLIDGEHVDLRTMAHSCNNEHDTVEIVFIATDGIKSIEKIFTFRLTGGLCQCEYNKNPVLIFK